MNLQYCRYLGNHVATIYNFGYGGGGYAIAERQLEEIKKGCAKEINEYSYLDLIAITADSFQQHIFKFLLAQGFKQAITFKSAHMDKNEFLTLWIKKGVDAENKRATNKRTPDTPPENCSVGYNEYKGRFILATSLAKMKELIGIDQIRKKIRGFNLWYRVSDVHVKKRW